MGRAAAEKRLLNACPLTVRRMLVCWRSEDGCASVLMTIERLEGAYYGEL